MTLDHEFYQRLFHVLEALNLRGQRCPMCYQPRPGPCSPGCELQEVLTHIRKNYPG